MLYGAERHRHDGNVRFGRRSRDTGVLHIRQPGIRAFLRATTEDAQGLCDLHDFGSIPRRAEDYNDFARKAQPKDDCHIRDM
jgi:hypothetical protein